MSVDENTWYRFKVTFEAENLENPNLHVLNMLEWFNDQPYHGPHDVLTNFTQESRLITGEQLFFAHEKCRKVQLQLGLRYSADGKITWHSAEFEKASAPAKHRKVKLSVLRWSSNDCNSLSESMECIRRYLDDAGAQGTDLLLFPEFSYSFHDAKFSEIAVDLTHSDHELLRLVSEKAKQYHMYVVMGIIEREGDFLYNTAIVYDRSGQLFGKYRKIHPYFPEEFCDEITPGQDIFVMPFDFGNVGIMICYDSWHVELARLLSLKGAELILLPNAGCEPKILPARAIDNGVYLATSSMNQLATIYNAKGDLLTSAVNGIACAEIDLDDVRLPHVNAGGIINGSPGGKRIMKNCRCDWIYEELLREIRKFTDRPCRYNW